MYISAVQPERGGHAAHTIRKCKKMAGQNTFEILLLNDANMIGEQQETRMSMDVLLRKLPFCPELTQFLDLKETKTHYGRCFKMAHPQHFK